MNLEAFKAWLEDRGLRPKTIAAYCSAVRFSVRTGDPVEAVKASKSPGRRTLYYAALRQYATHLGGQQGADLLLALHALPRSRVRAKPPKRPLSNAEWDALLQAISEAERPLAHVLELVVLTGLRSSDVLNIEHDWVRQGLADGTMYLEQKGGNFRPFPVEGQIRRVLRELDEGWRWKRLGELVAKSGGGRADYLALYRGLGRAAETAGLEKGRRNPHLLRATAAVQLYRRTRDIHAVQQWLGHADIGTTQTYLRYVDPDDLGDSYKQLEESRRRK